MIILLIEAHLHLQFSRNLQKRIFLQARPSKSAILPWKYNQYNNPRALILNIDRATDCSWLQNRSGWKYKIFTLYRCNFFNFQYHNIPLRWLSTASSTGHFDYSYGNMCVFAVACLFIHHVKFHHAHFYFFDNPLCF